VEKQEALHFKGMMRSGGRQKSVKKVKVKEDDLAGYKDAYGRALERVKEVFVRQE
jgi:ATP-dependent RNA helicase DDX51/DBP6